MKFFLKRICTILFILAVVLFVSFTTYRRIKIRRIINETLTSEHWTERMKAFQEEPSTTGHIVFLGNSLTEGFDLKILGDSTIINRGISGDFSEGLLKRLDEVIALKPSKLFIDIGINDLIEHVSVKEICRNYQKIIERVQKESPSTSIYMQSLLPVHLNGSFLTSNEDVNEVVKEQNAELKALADKMKIPFIDLYSHFVVNNEMNPRLTYDGIHLVKEGYEIWKGVLTPYLADARGQIFTGSNVSKANPLYDFALKINTDSSIVFTFCTKENSTYAEYLGRIKKRNDTLFHISASMALGKFDCMRLEWVDPKTHVVNDTIYFGLDSAARKLIHVTGGKYANGRSIPYNDKASNGSTYTALDRKYLNGIPGLNYYTIITSTNDKITGKPLTFKVSFNSQPGFYSGDKAEELDLVIKGSNIYTIGRPLMQTGHFKLTQKSRTE